VNVNEAKLVLQLYRPGTADAEDPQIAEALALAKREPELAIWLERHCARQSAIGEKFRQIIVPAGLKEQIISEQAAQERMASWRPRAALAAVVTIVLLAVLGTFWFSRPAKDDTLAVFQNQMAGIALRGYGMDLTTNNPEQVRAYLAQNKAPSDYVLPAALQKAAVVGCAVEGWQKVKVSMICFRTGRPLPPNQASDLWLFVVDRATLADAPAAGETRFVTVNRLSTAVWSQGDKVYLLGTEGDESTVRHFL
jgi:hypothetical protein